MKVVQYINNDNEEDVIAIAVSAWSVKKNGNLPTNTKYILYTDAESNFENELLKKVYDKILPLPFDTEWFESLPWQDSPQSCPFPPGAVADPVDLKKGTGKVSWRKFLCFLNTPCDGGPVITLDWDTLCLRGICGILPPYPRTWSCHRSQEGYYNNGIVVKTPRFDQSDAPECMKEPLKDIVNFKKLHNIRTNGDEVGTRWYEMVHGTSSVWPLHYNYNYPATFAIKHNIDVNSRNIKILHYIYDSKPWRSAADPNSSAYKTWWSIRKNMFKTLGLKDPKIH